MICLIRHGQTDWNAERRLQGQADVPVNAVGLAQAEGNGRTLARLIGQGDGFDFVASPLIRTRQTMEAVRRAMGLDPALYRTDARLREVHFGDWQGHTFAEIALTAPDLVAARQADKWHFRPPGAEAESYALLYARVLPVLEAIERPSVIVAHGGIVRVVTRAWGGASEAEASAMDIPQDRILVIEDRRLTWV